MLKNIWRKQNKMTSKKVRRLINGAMMDEIQARKYYNHLLSLTRGNPKLHRTITEIRNDEIDHFKKLKKLKGGNKK
jgi:rubrerythrin